MTRLLIFDFDGVVADSEIVANRVLAEMVTDMGFPTTLEQSYQNYMGKTFAGVMDQVETITGDKLPATFSDDFQARLIQAFLSDLKPVDGAMEFIASVADMSKCIASNSSPDRLKVCLDVLGLGAVFGEHVFSAANLSQGKPHPEIFLMAAENMAAEPQQAIVIEDSVSGVRAGVAANMTVIGLLAASHIQQDHGKDLLAAGADYVADTYDEVRGYLDEILS